MKLVPYPQVYHGRDVAFSKAPAHQVVSRIGLNELAQDTVQFSGRRQDRKLFKAAEKNDANGIKQWAASGANINAQDKDHYTPLMKAVSAQSYEAAQALIALKADASKVSHYSDTALTLAVTTKNDAKLVKQNALIASLVPISPVNKINTDRWTALTLAARAGLTEGVKILLAGGADPKLANKEGMTPLMYAAWNNDGPMLEALANALPQADQRAYVNTTNKWGRTAMDIAAGWKHKDVIGLLFKYGSNPSKVPIDKDDDDKAKPGKP